MCQKRTLKLRELIEEVLSEIRHYDRRSPTILSETAARLGHHKRYPDALIALFDHPDQAISSGATWMFRSHLENGHRLTSAQLDRLLANLEGVTAAWDAQLHVCQLIRHIDLNGPSAQALVAWLEPLLDHKRPFVRAWALDALCHIATQHPVYEESARVQLQHAINDPAASVRARARHLARE